MTHTAKLAMSNLAWTPDDRLKAYELLAEQSFSGLEIAPSLFFHAADDLFNPAPDVARVAFSELSAAGLSLVSMQSLLFGVENASLFGIKNERARFEKGLSRAIALAARFNIPNLVMGSPQQRIIPCGMAPEKRKKLHQKSFSSFRQSSRCGWRMPGDRAKLFKLWHELPD